MALKIPCSLPPKKIFASPPRKTLIVAACALTCVWMQSPVALAQHGTPVGGGHTGGGHPSAGGHGNGRPVSAPHVIPPRAAIPPAVHAPISRPPVVFGPQAGFGQRPIFIRHRVFHRSPFFVFGLTYPGWWANCGAVWALDFGCGWRVPEYPVENYVAPPLVIYEPEYVYYGGQRELVLLFLRDGTAYSVTDYWFVNDEVHFTPLEEGGTKSVEQVIGLDELDLQKTIDVNSRRGFRFVRRDEPLEQYQRDHPDANPPLVEAPQKNE